MINERSISKIMLTEQIDRMVANGYPELLQVSKEDYRNQLTYTVEQTDTHTQGEELLSLVDVRIPFNDQLKALGIEANPALYYQPKHSTHRPYVARIQLIHPFDQKLGGSSYREMVTNLPNNLRAASPFEGLSIFMDILARGFATFPGGRYDAVPSITGDNQTLFQYHCLERFLGKPRMSFIEAQSFDYFVHLAVAKRSHA